MKRTITKFKIWNEKKRSDKIDEAINFYFPIIDFSIKNLKIEKQNKKQIKSSINFESIENFLPLQIPENFVR